MSTYTYSEDNRASYCPEDNKLRLYVGRVPRDEYEKLRVEGWISTPKQDCDFVATWTPQRRDTCLDYADLIEDEDQSPEDRAADRAERFSGYLGKRLDEATEHADHYEPQPGAHGYQSQSRAERAARRHDRIADKATDAWSKAEYWQQRTTGVISHALYVCRPDVRMGRIKTLEAELRRHQSNCAEVGKTWRSWKKLSEMTDPERQTRLAQHLVSSEADYSFHHPRPETVTNAHIRENGSSLWTLMGMVEQEHGSDDITGAEACALWLAKHPAEPVARDRWTEHYELRLAYENQMLEAQGGRAAHVEMEPGGWLGSHQIQKVNKSHVTGRVVSVAVLVPTHGRNRWGNPYPEGVTAPTHRAENIETERLAASVYRPPTDEERAAFLVEKKARKASAPKVETVPLINPTDEDAERLQAELNAHAAANTHRFSTSQAKTVTRITQAQYSAASKGSYSRVETRGLHGNAELADRQTNMYSRHEEERRKRIGPALCNIRITGYMPASVIILTDKPQKPLPAAVWEKPAVVESEVRA